MFKVVSRLGELFSFPDVRMTISLDPKDNLGSLGERPGLRPMSLALVY